MDTVMGMKEFTLLGFYEDIREKVKNAKASDFAKALGVQCDNQGFAKWWSQTNQSRHMVAIFNPEFNGEDWELAQERTIGIRPVIRFSSLELDMNSVAIGDDGLKYATFGEYPQKIPSALTQDVLNDAFNKNRMTLTGKKYTVDRVENNSLRDPFRKLELSEYEYSGHKYIMVKNSSATIPNMDNCWVEVTPIEWIIDSENHIAISKNVLISGIQFDNREEYDGVISNTHIYKFLNKYFANEIVVKKKLNVNDQTLLNTAENPYDFDFQEQSEEDIIKEAIESNIPVFLHGLSGEGKSARVKSIDPNCTIVYLRNATPESLNGKSVYNETKNEMMDIKPTWYVNLCKKCEQDKDKLHILFLDELTNALPSIQGMAFNIVLDKEVNGMWQLPSNCRIVAAGNDVDDSLAANPLVEPLFNRFAHVYIETTTPKWLEWASEHDIHPSICGYIAYRSSIDSDVLRTNYNGETPNADPRRWEMASKLLKSSRNPNTLRSVIGEELTADFISFCKQRVITIESVLNDEFDLENINMDVASKYATAVGLSSCSEKELLKIREFVKKLGPEMLATFDMLWAKDDQKKLEKLSELDLIKQSRR